MTAVPAAARGRLAPGRRRTRDRSIRGRIIGLLLWLAVPLVVLAFGSGAYLAWPAYQAKAIAESVRQVSIPAVSGLVALERERSLSLAALSGALGDPRSLVAQRQHADQGLAAMRRAAGPALAHAPAEIRDRMRALTTQVDRLPSIRAQIDARSVTAADAAAFYNHTLDTAAALFDAQARLVPDAAAVPGALAAVDMFRISDLMSRAAGTATTALASGQMSPMVARDFVRLVDTYHQRLTTITPVLRPHVRASAHRLVAGQAWQRLGSVEDRLVDAGHWRRHHTPAALPTIAEWTRLTGAVSDGLVALTQAQADEVSAQAVSDGTRQLWIAGAGGFGAVVMAIAVIAWAIVRSGTLVHGTLLPRIEALDKEGRRRVDRLIEIMGLIRAGQPVDLDVERRQLAVAVDTGDSADKGSDELTCFAANFNRALTAAVDVAVTEVQGRRGARDAVLGIARRHQKPLHQLLRHLRDWQQTEQDPERMERWFALEHLARQIRSLTDGLITLAGGQPGRPDRDDQTLLDVLRHAQSDSTRYQRIKLEAPPPMQVAGRAVAHLIPMLTQLINNALAFSNPESQVTVRAVQVAHGVAVEIEDRGVGMAAPRLEQANRMLREAPDFSVAALGDKTQLGLWVVAILAQRAGAQVELRTSPYGGVLAIVLLPAALLVTPRRTPDSHTTPPAQITASPAAAYPEPPPPAPALRPVRDPGASLGEPPPPASGRHSYDTGGRTTMPPRRPTPAPAPTDLAPTTPGDRPCLPTRRRGEHMAPALRAGQQEPEPAEPPTPPSAEQSRDSLSAFQRGSQAGRERRRPVTHPTTSTDRNENGI